MVARSPRDVIDYFDDNAENEDETPFLPVRPEGDFLNPWSGFYGGLLIGLAGGGLATLAPWLAGLLIFAGYGMTALTLRRTRRRLFRALGLGFGVIALAGAAVVLGEVFFPLTTSVILAAAAARHMIFLSVVALPWAIGFAWRLFTLLFA
jgi:hypothetical protein